MTTVWLEDIELALSVHNEHVSRAPYAQDRMRPVINKEPIGELTVRLRGPQTSLQLFAKAIPRYLKSEGVVTDV